MMITFILMITGLIAWIFINKKSGFIKKGGPMQLLQTLHLGQKERLVLVKVEDNYLVLGATPSSINLLQQLETPVSLKEQAKNTSY